MGRKSINSKTRSDRKSSKARGETPARKGDLSEQILETKLRSEQAKLSLLEAKLPETSTPQYTRYVDMPPPTPEDEAMFDAEFQKILASIFDGPCEPSGPEKGQTLQDWLREQGAVIPETPEWQVPLYLEQWDLE